MFVNILNNLVIIVSKVNLFCFILKRYKVIIKLNKFKDIVILLD